jgi:hypothetical protein
LRLHGCSTGSFLAHCAYIAFRLKLRRIEKKIQTEPLPGGLYNTKHPTAYGRFSLGAVGCGRAIKVRQPPYRRFSCRSDEPSLHRDPTAVRNALPGPPFVAISVSHHLLGTASARRRGCRVGRSRSAAPPEATDRDELPKMRLQPHNQRQRRLPGVRHEGYGQKRNQYFKLNHYEISDIIDLLG